MDHVINKTENEVGQCGPLSNVYNATLTTVCDKISLQMVSVQKLNFLTIQTIMESFIQFVFINWNLV